MDHWMIAAASGVLTALIAVGSFGIWLVARRSRVGTAREPSGFPPVAALDASDVPTRDLDAERHREFAHLARVSMVGELSGAIAHELNQPLTAILANAQAAQRMLKTDGADSREVYDILGDIISEDKRAVQVIQRLRALLTKHESEAQMLNPSELAQEVLALANSTLIASKVAVTARYARDIPNVLADRVQIQQVLLNLILNAVDAMAVKQGAERQLTLATALAADGAVLITVSDNGSGILADNFGRLFDPYYTTKPNGLGLGLSISKAIVNAHGGRIWAVNNPDAGATFCLTLPNAKVEPTGSGVSSLARSLAAVCLVTLGFVWLVTAAV